MIWTSEHILFMHYLYVRGDSTQNIAKECSRAFHVEVPISKNAIVGKVHRLHKAYPNAGWDGRPSPIRREPSKLPSGGPPNRVPPSAPPSLPASTLPPLPSSLVAPPKPFVDRPPAFMPQASSSPPPAPEPPAFSPPPQKRHIQCEGTPDAPKRVRRRDGTGCAWPMGDPGSARFHYCDCDLYNLTKPYCEEHADKAYVKERPAKGGARIDG